MVEAASEAFAQNKQLIDMLRRSRLFRDYECVFSKATGLPLALRPLEYWQHEHHNKTNENPFCRMLAERPATLAVCLQSHAEIVSHTGATPRTETCPFGLTETAEPVRLGERTIGFLRIGQVLRRSAIESDKSRAARKLAECGVRFKGAIRKAWRRRRLFRRTDTARLCGCSRFSPRSFQVSPINLCWNDKTQSRRLYKRRVSTSRNIRPKNCR